MTRAPQLGARFFLPSRPCATLSSMKRWWTDFFAALRRGHRFVTRDVWHIGMPGEQIPHGFIIKNVRVVILLVRGVTDETLLLRASALTFATILFLVPFLAFMFAFIQTFNLGDQVYSQMSETLNSRLNQFAEIVRADSTTEADRHPGRARRAPLAKASGPETRTTRSSGATSSRRCFLAGAASTPLRGRTRRIPCRSLCKSRSAGPPTPVRSRSRASSMCSPPCSASCATSSWPSTASGA
jgi:hypothetical protein